MEAGRLYEPSGILPGPDSPPVILSASFFNTLKTYHINVVELGLAACGLPLRGPCLVPDPGTRRLGACSLEPLIRIRGPCLAHPLLMIFKSSAMVESCGADAWLTSIVNFFMFLSYFLIVSVSRRLQLEACGLQLPAFF